jgi:hypothetical protein
VVSLLPTYHARYEAGLLTVAPRTDARASLVSATPPSTVTTNVPPAPNNAAGAGGAGAGAGGRAAPAPLSGRTSARHTGHVVLDRSHASTHSTWKTWAQLGSARTFSPSSSSDRHTAHSAAAAAAVEVELEELDP